MMKITNFQQDCKTGFKHLLFGFWKKLMEFLFPAFCLGCKKEGQFACSPCLEKVERFLEYACPLCEEKNLDGKVCSSCLSENFFLDSVIAVGSFHSNPLLERWIHAFKYDFIEDLAMPLGDLLFEILKKCPFPDHIFCPVPLHPRRLRFRGFNQSELLISQLKNRFEEYFSRNLKTYPLLKRIHFHTPQMELSREKRFLNVKNAFQIDKKYVHLLNGAKILLVDDVATTLATLNSCARILKKAGAAKVSTAVLAKA